MLDTVDVLHARPVFDAQLIHVVAHLDHAEPLHAPRLVEVGPEEIVRELELAHDGGQDVRGLHVAAPPLPQILGEANARVARGHLSGVGAPVVQRSEYPLATTLLLFHVLFHVLLLVHMLLVTRVVHDVDCPFSSLILVATPSKKKCDVLFSPRHRHHRAGRSGAARSQICVPLLAMRCGADRHDASRRARRGVPLPVRRMHGHPDPPHDVQSVQPPSQQAQPWVVRGGLDRHLAIPTEAPTVVVLRSALRRARGRFCGLSHVS